MNFLEGKSHSFGSFLSNIPFFLVDFFFFWLNYSDSTLQQNISYIIWSFKDVFSSYIFHVSPPTIIKITFKNQHKQVSTLENSESQLISMYLTSRIHRPAHKSTDGPWALAEHWVHCVLTSFQRKAGHPGAEIK